MNMHVSHKMVDEAKIVFCIKVTAGECRKLKKMDDVPWMHNFFFF